MLNRLKQRLASLPADLPESITRPMAAVGGDRLYSAIGKQISNTGMVDVQHQDLHFMIKVDLGNPIREIERFGLYEPPVSKKLMEELDEGDTFVDFGASFGYFPSLAAHFTPPEKTYGVEPNPTTREIFERNNERVADGQITIDPYFIGSKDKEVEKTLTVYSGLPAGEPKEIDITTRQVQVDTFVQEKDIHPAFILADIDGGEASLIESATETLSDHTPKLLLEIHPELLQEQDISHKALLNELSQFGYEIEYATSYTDRTAKWKAGNQPSGKQPYHIFAV